NSPYNHAALYIGNGEVVEAVGEGVHRIKMTDFLKQHDDLVRSMVLQRENLTDRQRDAIVNFAKSKVGKKYDGFGAFSVGMETTANTDHRSLNVNQYDRDSYYCSQLVAAAYSYAGVPLPPKPLEIQPAELASGFAGNLRPLGTPLGALYERFYHRS